MPGPCRLTALLEGEGIQFDVYLLTGVDKADVFVEDHGLHDQGGVVGDDGDNRLFTADQTPDGVGPYPLDNAVHRGNDALEAKALGGFLYVFLQLLYGFILGDQLFHYGFLVVYGIKGEVVLFDGDLGGVEVYLYNRSEMSPLVILHQVLLLCFECPLGYCHKQRSGDALDSI